jgi:TonB-dependent SusC/RagA subfamily outer membrane receptor
MKRLMLIALSAVICNVAFAQIRVTGKVTSSQDGSPVPFASVVVKGTMQGIATLDDGTYVLDGVPANATLVFSSIGFSDLEVPVEGRNVVNAILTPDAEALEEVMVVAYGTVKKGSYSGSATVVDQETIKDAPIVSFEQVLAGKAPGVQAVSISGQPGADSQIRIRGYGSFNAGNAPLYVIDGVPATSGNWSSGNASASVMNFLNPSDIESFTILKDAAAASLYGSRASNGVILITTKRGKSGKLTSTFKASAGFSYFAYNHLPLATDEQTETLHREAWTN